jgi:hypothetical protein
LVGLAGLAALAALASFGLVAHTISLNGTCGDRFYYPCQEARRDNAATAAPYLLLAIVFTALAVTLALLRGTATTWVILVCRGWKGKNPLLKNLNFFCVPPLR